jgi:hypothetical protein
MAQNRYGASGLVPSIQCDLEVEGTMSSYALPHSQATAAAGHRDFVPGLPDIVHEGLKLRARRPLPRMLHYPFCGSKRVIAAVVKRLDDERWLVAVHR